MMNREQLQDIFRQPYNAQTWQGLLINLFGASEIRRIPSTLTSDSNEKVEGFQLGTLTTTNRYEIGLFAFEIKGGMNLKLNRVGLRSLVKSYISLQVDAAIVVFYDATHWRLSFICDIKEQKTATKRYTYVFGNPIESYRTASAMLAKLSGDAKLTFDQIKAAFSVEALSKDFFKGYKERYVVFCKNVAEQFGREEKWHRDYVKKMMGRLVFLQFLQKKGWMGVPANQKDWEGGNLQYTQKLIKQYSGNDKLLSEILEPLFFDTLNTKREGDIADPKLGNNIKIPYLNGGLFDQDKLDEKEIDFPYVYFAELMDFFSQYNFTIDENDPNDAEVGIDPEMLGHIFENLLEDNKDKGAFYTPKEIVQYMCRQSLIEYLQSKLGKHTEIEDFINNHDTGNRLDGKNYIAANAKAIEELLDCVKICDPAIGSGAFPMGVLSEIFQAKMALDMTLDRAAVKKNIIQNSIYGVDIEQGAVDIARLRFWLSLVVDEDEPQPLPNLDYKIMCGNSLLSRFSLDTPINEVFAQYNKEHKTNFTLESYRQLVQEYTNTTSHETKAEFRRVIEEIKGAFKTELGKDQKMKRIRLSNKIQTLESVTLFGPPTKENLKEAKELRKTLDKLLQAEQDITSNKLYEDSFEWRFEFPQLLDDDGSFVGFDIIIGNPPYVLIQSFENKQLVAYYKQEYAVASYKVDLYHLFIEAGVRLIGNKGVLSYINPSNFLTNNYTVNLRSYILENTSLLNVINIEDNVFQAQVNTCVIILRKETLNDNTLYYSSGSITSNKFNIIAVSESAQENYLKADECIIQPLGSDCEIGLVNKIESKSKILKSYATVNFGMQLRNRKEFLTDVLEKPVLSELTDYHEKCYTGRDVRSYITTYNDLYCYYNEEAKCGGCWDRKVHFTKNKILVRQIGETPICSIDEIGMPVLNSAFMIISETVGSKYLLALFNSKLLKFYWRNKFQDKRKTFPKIKGGYLEKLPIMLIDDEQPFIDLVDEILKAKRLDPKADTNVLEKEIDQMIYALYNLTPDEIAIIEK